MATAPETLNEHACFGGVQRFLRHASSECAGPMRFALYLPPAAARGPVPLLWCLAGLTCTEETFATKAGAQRLAAELGIALLMPDTSPREPRLDGDDSSWDFGRGAGFYLDATQAPWSAHYRMYGWLTRELPALLREHYPMLSDAQSIMGHSMGGHGALVIALKNPGRYRSVSAFAPIAAPSRCPWGEKAFSGYLGPDCQQWLQWDACALIEAGARLPDLLVDQGLADQFLPNQLNPDRLEQVCRAAGQPLSLRRHPGYDHGYYFISSFVEDHLRFHAAALSR